MHGHRALLIDMGFSSVPEPTAVACNHQLTWADVHESQQDSRASLVLVVGAESVIEERNKYFPGWKFQKVNATACTLHCAWDPTIWSSPGDCMTVSLVNGRCAMSIDLEYSGGASASHSKTEPSQSSVQPPASGEAFQLILTKLFKGTQASNYHLSADTANDCWRRLTRTAIRSQRWIITGGLATCNKVTMLNRFAYHDDDSVRLLKVGMVTNEAASLAAVSCNMDLAVAPALGDAQSMVIHIPAKQQGSVQSPATARQRATTSHSETEPSPGSVQPPASKKARTQSGPAPSNAQPEQDPAPNPADRAGVVLKSRVSAWLSLCAEATDEATNLLSRLLFLPRGEVLEDKHGIAWEKQAELARCADKIETGMNMIRDAREHAKDAPGVTPPGELSSDEFSAALQWLKDLHRESNPSAKRAEFRAFIRQTVGDFSFAMHLLRHGIEDSDANLAQRYLYVQEAKATNASERQGVPTRASHPELFAQARRARTEFYKGEKLAMDIEAKRREYDSFTPSEQHVFQEYDHGTLYKKMVAANKEFGHGQGVEEQLSAAQLANLRLLGDQLKKGTV